MPFKAGQSGNPGGRPPKHRALSDMLTRTLGKAILTPSGSISGKRVLAKLVVQALTEGQVQFPQDDKPSQVGVKDWMEFVKWFYQYVEPAPVKNEHTGEDGSPLKVLVEYVNNQAEVTGASPSAIDDQACR
jgi:hypothetical protein